jgi:transposase
MKQIEKPNYKAGCEIKENEAVVLISVERLEELEAIAEQVRRCMPALLQNYKTAQEQGHLFALIQRLDDKKPVGGK